MTTGKRSATVNSRLRAQLAEAEAARRKLEHRIVEAERQAADLQQWKDAATSEAHPAIVAERARADAAVRKATDDVLAERAAWHDKLRAAHVVYLRVAEAGAGLFGEDSDIEALTILFDGVEGVAVFESDMNRAARRNTATGESFRGITALMKSVGMSTISTGTGMARVGEGRARGLAAVEDAKARRLEREAAQG